MTRHHHDPPRRGADCDRPRSVGAPDASFDAALPILRELEDLIHAAATDHSDAPSGSAVPTTTLPSRSVRLSGTPASRTASAVDGAGCP